MKHTSIKSVLAQVALVLDDRYWNETVILEHAARAYRQMNLEHKYETAVEELDLKEHKAFLPDNLKYIVQLGYVKETTSDTTKPALASMRITTNSFHNSICLESCFIPCPNCKYEYSVSPSGVITSNIKEGKLLLAYLKYPEDEEGYPLILDDENVKEALIHYLFYRYWLQKDLMKEEGASQRMSFHLSMWNTLSTKALSANLPTLDTMENIKNNFNRIVPRHYQHGSFFSDLNNNENTSII